MQAFARIYRGIYCSILFYFILFSAPGILRRLHDATMTSENYRLSDAIALREHIKNEKPAKGKLVKHKNYDEEEAD
jgi:hypothetical protein